MSAKLSQVWLVMHPSKAQDHEQSRQILGAAIIIQKAADAKTRNEEQRSIRAGHLSTALPKTE